MGLVRFVTTTSAGYSGITPKDKDTLYFISDERRIYKGEVPYSGGIFTTVAEFPETGEVNTLYVNSATGEVRYYNGTSYQTVVPATGKSITGKGDGSLATTAAVAAYVTSQIGDLNISALKGRVDTLEGEMDTAQGQITTINGEGDGSIKKAASDAAAALENAETNATAIADETTRATQAEQTLQTSIDAAKEAADAAQTDIDTLLPKTDFNTENTVKKYIDDNVNTLNALIDTDIVYFDTVADMMKSAYLEAGNVCLTLGFNSANDNGSSLYMLQTTAPHAPYTMPSGTPYGDVIRINDNLYAVLVAGTDVYAEQLGCVKNVSTFDNGEIINEFCKTYRIIFGSGIYYFINAINMFDARRVHLEGFCQVGDSNSESVTIFDFTNCKSQIAVNAAGACNCYLENINFKCGRYQSICLYMDTTVKTPYSQHNSFVGCTFKAAEDHSVLNGGSVGVYIGEAEISTFENCTFMGCRPLVYTLDDMYNARKIGNGTKSPHVSATFTSFTKTSLFISYAGSDIITLQGVQDVNFDNAYTQFYPDSESDTEQSHNVIRLCNINGHMNKNINGIFVSENNDKTAADVTELNIDGSLGRGPNNNLNIKANCAHPTALGIKLSSYLDISTLNVTGRCSNSIQTVGPVSVNLVHFVLSDAPGNIDHVYNCTFTGIPRPKLTITPACTGLEVQWSDPKYVKFAFGSYLGYGWGKPTRTDVEPGTIYFNMNVKSDAAQPIAYVFINNEWKKLTNGV